MSGSKNAALPILAATLLTDKVCVLKNVPDIDDVHTMISILRSLGSEVEMKGHTVKIQTKKIVHETMNHHLACKMRASVLLFGPMLARSGFAKMQYPGGCVLGARPIDTHADVFEQFGCKRVKGEVNEIIFEKASGKRTAGGARIIVLPEFSVTATENAIMLAARSAGKTEIRLAALEPHVQDLCVFMQKMGVKIRGVGTHILEITGSQKLRGAVHSVTPDYLEAGTFALAAALTNGNVLIKNVIHSDLDAFWNLFREIGVKFELKKNAVHIFPSKGGVAKLKACRRLQTNVFPGFPTDLQPPFAVLLTQVAGKSLIHETLFEGRFAYFSDLEKMGAKITKLNPHEADIEGPTALRGAEIRSWDIRAGAAMILAALAAKGRTTVSDIHYIDRGYEDFDGKLRSLGAEIERLGD
jgi:UDP-N-acetylglucosamine 1-carboxyvinyltransferase